MGKKVWRIISCVLTLCLLVLSVNYLSVLMERKDSIVKHQPFFQQEADFDVLFLGSSHVLNGVFPMELWNDYGIVSYNFGGNSNRIPIDYWVMENALDYTTPELIVVDCFFLGVNHKTYDYSHLHISLDAFPLSGTKLKATLDLLNDPVLSDRRENGIIIKAGDEAGKKTPIEWLWNFTTYHARWNELTENDFRIIATCEKGAEPWIDVAVPPHEISKIDRSEKLKEDTVAIEYLRKLIEACQIRGIDIILTYLPFITGEAYQKEANRVYDIAAEYGINYINFLEMDIVDYDTDLADSGHLNPSGARKVTDYLGKYIIDNYQIHDQRSNSEYGNWFEDYQEYKSMKEEYLRNQNSWDTYLMLLADKNIDSVVEISNSDIWNDGEFVNLVQNLGIDMSSVLDTTNYLIIHRGGIQAEAVSLDMTADTQTNTVDGLLRILHDASSEYNVYLNDEECFLPNEDNNGNIRIYVRDSENLHTVGQAVF